MSIFLQLLFAILTLGSLYTLVTVGFSLIYAVTGVLHVAQGVTMMAGAYVFLDLANRGLPAALAAVAAVAVGGATGGLMNAVVFEPLRRQGKVSSVGALIASVALLVAGSNVLLLVFGPGTKTLVLADRFPRWTVGGASLGGSDALAIAVTVALIGAVGFLYRRTKIGTALRATADHATVAEVIGINTRRVRQAAFLLGSTLAAVAGVLFTLRFGIEANHTVPVALKAFGRAVVGGVGSIGGAILGNALIETAENVGAFYVTSAFKDVFSFLVIFIFLLARPHGIFGARRD